MSPRSAAPAMSNVAKPSPVGLFATGVGPVADDDAEAGVAQVLRLRASLNAVAENGDGLPRQGAGIRIGVVEDFDHDGLWYLRAPAPI